MTSYRNLCLSPCFTSFDWHENRSNHCWALKYLSTGQLIHDNLKNLNLFGKKSTDLEDFSFIFHLYNCISGQNPIIHNLYSLPNLIPNKDKFWAFTLDRIITLYKFIVIDPSHAAIAKQIEIEQPQIENHSFKQSCGPKYRRKFRKYLQICLGKLLEHVIWEACVFFRKWGQTRNS